MKVIMLIHSFYPHVGGAERQLLEQIPFFIKYGIDVTVITRAEQNTLPKEELNGAEIIRTKTSKIKILSAINYIVTALNEIKKIKPDLIHSYDLISTSTTALIANRLYKIPYLIKILNSGTGSDIKRLKRKILGKLRFTQIKNTTSGFFGISDQIIQELKEENIPDKKIIKIFNGIDSNKFIPLQEDLKQKQKQELNITASFIGIYAGRFVKNKNIIDLITAWNYFSKMNKNTALILIGEGSEKETLQEHDNQHIHFLPKTDNILPYLQIADCFLLASDHEGISNALLESMSCQVVPIVSEVPGNKELIQEDQTGYFFELHNIDQIIKCVEILKDNPIRHNQLKTNARKFIHQNFDIDILVKIIIEKYKEALNV